MNNALAANLSPHELALIEKRIRDLNTRNEFAEDH